MRQTIVQLLSALVVRFQAQCRCNGIARLGELRSHSEFCREVDPGFDVTRRGMHGGLKVLNSAGGISAARQQIAEFILRTGQVWVQLDRLLQLGPLPVGIACLVKSQG